MSNLVRAIDSVTTLEELSEFITQLSKDLKSNKAEWENADLHSFLEAMSAWVYSMEGYYKNKGDVLPDDIPWKLFASILYAAKVYE